MADDFLSQYLHYSRDTEVPIFFHRWSAIIGIAAILGRDYHVAHGHFTINPNIYGMLIGSPGTRKSTAIKMMKTVIVKAGYTSIAADKTTKEKFLMDLAGVDVTYDQSGGVIKGTKGKEIDLDAIIDSNLWGDDDVSSKPPAETFIMADEFNDFFGNGNIEFISLLGTLWDYSGIYSSRIKNGKSIAINNPTINILGGNTPTGFSLAFPTEILGQGFFSRILLIYGEPTGRKITFPTPPSTEDTRIVVDALRDIKKSCIGYTTLSDAAMKLLDKIYKTDKGIDDVRFSSYSNRRFTHLLKLCMVCSAARCSNTISDGDVIYANTILTHTERLMPKALGEFGKSRNSDVAHKIIQLLEASNKPVPVKEIFRHVHNDLSKQSELSDILINLQAADKIQNISGLGFLCKKQVQDMNNSDVINFDLLSEEERNMR